jgi:hypothetical protein
LGEGGQINCSDAWKKLVRAAGLEPAQALRPYGFSYRYGFRRLARWQVCTSAQVRGLDYPFTLAFADQDDPR